MVLSECLELGYVIYTLWILMLVCTCSFHLTYPHLEATTILAGGEDRVSLIVHKSSLVDTYDVL